MREKCGLGEALERILHAAVVGRCEGISGHGILLYLRPNQLFPSLSLVTVCSALNPKPEKPNDFTW